MIASTASNEGRIHFILTCIGGLTVFTSFGLIMAALPAELALEGWSPVSLGIVISGHAVGAISFRIVGFAFVDRVGPRRAARTAAMGGALACLLLPFATVADESIAGVLMFLSKTGHGCALACFITAGLTSAASSGNGDAVAKRIGVFSGVASLGLLAGPPAGIFLWTHAMVTTVWYLPSACMFTALFLVPPAERAGAIEPADAGVPRRRFPTNLRSNIPAIVSLALAAILQGAAEAHLPSIIAAFNSTPFILYLYLAFGFSIAAAKLGCGYVIAQIGSVRTINFGIILLLPAFAMPMFGPANASTLTLSSVLLGLGSGLIGTAAVTKVSAETSPTTRGAAIGFCALTQEVGLAMGAVVFGATLSILGPAQFFPAGLLLSSIVLTIFNYRQITRNQA